MKFSNSFEEIVYRDYGDDMDLFFDTLKAFSDKEYISTASIQRVMKVSYARASVVLGRFIRCRFASPQIGYYPCKRLLRKMN